MSKIKRTLVPMTIRLPKAIHQRVAQIQEAKPHYTRQAIIIEAILAGLEKTDAS